jgi:hypothetical protein
MEQDQEPGFCFIPVVLQMLAEAYKIVGQIVLGTG